jgi:ParB-like nuclease domain
LNFAWQRWARLGGAPQGTARQRTVQFSFTGENSMLIAVEELVFDPSLYPRTKPSAANVAAIAEAMRAGVKFKPIVVEKKTKRIVDGIHRWTAWKQVYEKDSKIECELITETDEGKLLAMSVDLNAEHGLQLAAYERTDCFIRMERLGVTRETALQVLRMTEQKAERIEATRTAFRIGDTGEKEKVALKGNMRTFQGQTLTPAQEKANEHSSGMKIQFYVSQLTYLLDAGIAARATKSELAFLIRLRGLLNEKLTTNKKRK